jgi:hypothetical protein
MKIMQILSVSSIATQWATYLSGLIPATISRIFLAVSVTIARYSESTSYLILTDCSLRNPES